MIKRTTLEETATYFRVSTKTLTKYVKLYKIPHVRFGRNPSFNIPKVEEYLETRNITFNDKPIKARREVRLGAANKPSRFDEALGLG
jgi:hypothetical protein